jgi:hypothetical protein
LSINPEFRHEALFLSSQLNLSELVSARFLSDAFKERSRTGRGVAETAILLYYEERAQTIEALEAILNIPHPVLQGFAAELIDSRIPKGTTTLSWAEYLLAQIDEQARVVESIRSGVPRTTTAGAGPTASLSQEMRQVQIDNHLRERRDLAHIFYYLAASRRLRKSELLALAKWLSAADPSDAVLVPLFTAFLAAIDTLRPASEGVTAYLRSLYDDPAWIKPLHFEIVQKPWKATGAHAATQLAWTLFLIQAAQENVSLQDEELFSESALENCITTSVRSGAFQWLSSEALAFKRVDLETKPPAAQVVDPGFSPRVVEHVDQLIETFIVRCFLVIRRMKHREEDARLAPHPRTTKSVRRPLTRSGEEEPPQPATPRHDIEDLFGLIGLLYREEPDRALKYWEAEEAEDDLGGSASNLSYFVTWAAEGRSNSMSKAYLEMLYVGEQLVL